MNAIKPLETPVLLVDADIMGRYHQLADRQNIEDVKAYGSEWAALALDFDNSDRPYMAALCYARAEYYGVQPLGEYVRVVDGSFSELIPVLLVDDSYCSDAHTDPEWCFRGGICNICKKPARSRLE